MSGRGKEPSDEKGVARLVAALAPATPANPRPFCFLPNGPRGFTSTTSRRLQEENKRLPTGRPAGRPLIGSRCAVHKRRRPSRQDNKSACGCRVRLSFLPLVLHRRLYNCGTVIANCHSELLPLRQLMSYSCSFARLLAVTSAAAATAVAASVIGRERFVCPPSFADSRSHRLSHEITASRQTAGQSACSRSYRESSTEPVRKRNAAAPKRSVRWRRYSTKENTSVSETVTTLHATCIGDRGRTRVVKIEVFALCVR